MKTALSFGGGVQTTAILVLMAGGEIPKPDYIIFADTGYEWPETYDYIERYMKPLADSIKIPFETVKNKRDMYNYYWEHQGIPYIAFRNCTDVFKIRPIKQIYKRLEITTEVIGFSFEEQGRAFKKKRLYKNINSLFPLIDLRFTRHDCIQEIERFGLSSPLKSSCIFCPFQHPNRIARLSKIHPDLFEKVAQLEDRALERSPGYYISRKPWRQMAVPQADMFEDWDYGCGDGYCMR